MLIPHDKYQIIYLTKDDEILTYDGNFSYYVDYEEERDHNIRISIKMLKEFYDLKEVLNII